MEPGEATERLGAAMRALLKPAFLDEWDIYPS